MQTIMKRSRTTVAALAVTALLAGCANMSKDDKDTTRRTLSGTAIGTAAGAAIGEMATGQPLGGAAIGAAVGTVGGWLYDRHKKKSETHGN